ncbi:P-loop NTPase fold protein [Rhodospira trueperi]|uniref:P-loop NTPase fold protein n=1 Tax=Rhodospira trueperi TaxID=69960 RepID=UPI000B89569D|nr:P-loop NTPase fold protein [Rhodospira trueperi]
MARVTLPEPMWEKGAKVINPAIRTLIDRHEKDGPKAVRAQMTRYRRKYPKSKVEPSAPSSPLSEEAPEAPGSDAEGPSNPGEENTDDPSEAGVEPPRRAVETHETDYVSDRPEADRDLLDRASLAFALAHNINKIWTAQTAADETKDWGRKTLDGLHCERLTRRTREPDEAAFILHLDAPWGGGKTTFANFIARILNPAAHGYDTSDAKTLKGTLLGDLPLNESSYWPREFSTRRWFVVEFNAWQNEHVSPPWWNFYETIRRRCLRAILWEPGRFGAPRSKHWSKAVGTWFWFWMREAIWRLVTPATRRALVTTVLLIVTTFVVYKIGLLQWLHDLDIEGVELTSILATFASGGIAVFIFGSIRQGLNRFVNSISSSVDASKLGEADPVDRFRRHFSWFVGQLHQPVLVIVDDLDRCSAKYVVELVRGLLTIFRSPRVVFMLLGDKDWIETAFAKVHKEMADVHTGSQITFGGRFAEKAIQLSFLLPAPDPDARGAYLTDILATDQNATPEDEETKEALQKVEEQARADLAGTDRTEDQDAAAQRTEDLIDEASAQATPETRAAFEKAANRILDRERMLRAATARSTETVVRQHGLRPLKDFLPANPRRIKRIVNMVSAYQASAQATEGVALGSDQWKQLVIWVVIMSEYPQVWKTLVTDPDLTTRLLNEIKGSKPGDDIVPPALPDDASEDDKASHAALATLLATPGLVSLLRGDPFAEKGKEGSAPGIDVDASEWLRRLTPLD